MVWNSWCFRGWKKSHRQSILRKRRFAWFIHFVAFDVCWWIRESHWRVCVSTAIEIGKKRKSIYRKYVLESAPKNAGRNSNEDVVLSRSRGSPGQWFPETEYLRASTIFVVGTSGIPPNLNYRSVSPISVKQGGTKYHFLSLWYDSTLDWTCLLDHWQTLYPFGQWSSRIWWCT